MNKKYLLISSLSCFLAAGVMQEMNFMAMTSVFGGIGMILMLVFSFAD